MMSTIYEINYTDGDEADERPCLRCLAAPGAALLCAAREPAAARRRARAVAGAVSRAAPDRAGPADPDGAARRDAGLPRVERDGPGGPARVTRPGAAPSDGRGPAGEGAGSHANRFTAPDAAARSH